MPKSNSRSRNDRSDWGVMEMARERPIAAAAAAAGAAAAGLFLWSKRNQISHQISNLSDQIGEWTENMAPTSGNSARIDDTAGLTTTRSNMRSGAGSRSGNRTSATRATRATSARSRGMGKMRSAATTNVADRGGSSGNS